MTSTFKYRPPSFLRIEEGRFKQEVDKAVSNIYNAHGQLDGQAIKAPVAGAGFAVATGSETVTGAKTMIATGLATVNHVILGLDGATATNQWVTARVNPTNSAYIDIYVWMPTAAGDNTPIVSTIPTVVKWWATGSAP